MGVREGLRAAVARAAAGSTVATGVALSAVATVRNLGVWDNEGGASMRARGIRDVWATTRVRTKGWGGGAPADSTLATIRSKSLAFGGVRCPANPDEQTADARCTQLRNTTRWRRRGKRMATGQAGGGQCAHPCVQKELAATPANAE